MAAHIVRILSEIAENKVRPDQVKFALGHAPGCDLLSMDDWRKLNKACDEAPETLPTIAAELLPAYVAEYLQLDCPRNCEDWHKAKYNKDK